MEAKFNTRNPAVKRIMQEMKEVQNDTSCDFIAEALENDIFEWHFVIRGPPETEFEGGVYHGRILLPPEYPFKPPAFMMLTPSGRFETGVKICLSISSHHPEHWQPSWSVRTALTALIAFMPSPGQGALGSLDFPKEERKVLAAKANKEPPTFGSAERQKVIDDMHQRMLRRMEAAKAAGSSNGSAAVQPEQQQAAGEAAATATATATAAAGTSGQGDAPGTPSRAGAGAGTQPAAAPTTPVAFAATSTGVLPATPVVPATPTAAAAAVGTPGAATRAATPQARAAAAAAVAGPQSADQGLTLLAVALSVVIAALLLRKFLAAYGSAAMGDGYASYTYR